VKYKLFSCLASGYSKVSFYPVGQATAAIEKSLQIKYGFARRRKNFVFKSKYNEAIKKTLKPSEVLKKISTYLPTHSTS